MHLRQDPRAFSPLLPSFRRRPEPRDSALQQFLTDGETANIEAILLVSGFRRKDEWSRTKRGRSSDRPFSLLLFSYVILSISGVTSKKTGANTRDTMAISFNRIFRDGPEVSLNGSPTTSPSTAALCASEPLPP